jgi:hypothetical protein
MGVAMPDMTCLDTSCFGQMDRGNKAVAEGIEELVRSGEIVAVPDAVHQELKNAPDPVTRAASLRLIEDLKLRVLPKPDREAMGDQYNRYAQTVPGDKDKYGRDVAPGQPKTGGPGASPTNKDVVVVAQVAHYSANKPAGVGQVRLWTADRLKSQGPTLAQQYGVTLSPKCSIPDMPGGSPREHYSTVRGYFSNLPRIYVSADGVVTVVPPAPGGGGGGGGGGTTTIQPRGPDPGFKGSPGDVASRQAAVGGGVTLGLRVLDFGLNYLNDRILKQDIEAARDKIWPGIREELARNPSQGLLVVIYCRRPVAHPDSAIRPGDRFDHLEYGYGVNADEARAKMNATPSIRQGTNEKVETMVTTERWYAAAQPVGVDQLPTPYPKLALACFAFGKAKLQDVEWNGTFGFDDEAETTLSTGTLIPTFFVLRPPAEIKWVASAWAVDRHTLPLAEADAAKGGKITVVNLDPSLAFIGVAAAMVFPADEAAWDIFRQGPETAGPTGQLGRLNISKLRWVRPGNLEIIRRF